MYLGGNGVTRIVVRTPTFLVARGRVAGFLVAGGVGGEMDDAGEGMVVLGIQLVNISRSLNISVNCLWRLLSGKSLVS